MIKSAAREPPQRFGERSGEGLKTACKRFQHAAGNLQYCQDHLLGQLAQVRYVFLKERQFIIVLFSVAFLCVAH